MTSPSESAHILVVDDDEVSREALAQLLRDEGYRVSTADDGMAALAMVDRERPALVISDVRMPRGDGFELVRRIRARPATARLPVLLVSAQGAPDRRAAGLDLGADDFLAKPVEIVELFARVRSHLRRARDRAQLERHALVDVLTGVLNRRGIVDVLQREVAEARRRESPLSVLLVDVDRFKALNDAYGHQAGDTALRHVARVIADAVRIEDHVGRYGGDEFLVVLADTDTPAASALARRLRSLRVPPLSVGAADVEITVSVGVARLRPDDTVDSLVERADREMYRVKRDTQR